MLLAFFPLAFTKTCTAEMCAFTDDYAQFQTANTVVLPISVDSVPTLKEFKAKEHIAVDLLSDFKREVSRLYGTLLEDKFFSNRAYVLIEPDGIVRWTLPRGHAGHSPGERRAARATGGPPTIRVRAPQIAALWIGLLLLGCQIEDRTPTGSRRDEDSIQHLLSRYARRLGPGLERSTLAVLAGWQLRRAPSGRARRRATIRRSPSTPRCRAWSGGSAGRSRELDVRVVRTDLETGPEIWPRPG